MSLKSHPFTLDANGAGTVNAPGPAWLAGYESQNGPFTISRKGIQVASGGTALTSTTYGNETLVAGSIVLAGQPFDAGVIWFDFQ